MILLLPPIPTLLWARCTRHRTPRTAGRMRVGLDPGLVNMRVTVAWTLLDLLGMPDSALSTILQLACLSLAVLTRVYNAQRLMKYEGSQLLSRPNCLLLAQSNTSGWVDKGLQLLSCRLAQEKVNLELKTPFNPGEVYFRVQGVKIKCPKSEEFSGINT